ncbi:MAG: hypothetical protein H6Q15_284 [Bacteroidetes bacterium]|nr:hypothetical protein [Bacteroidota bacterium]
MKFDEYNIKARILPSIIILIPILLFFNNCKIDNIQVVFNNLLSVKIIGNVTLSIALLFLLVQVNRYIGKYIFEKRMYKKELDMPTTIFLLYSNSEFSKEYKNRLRKQIENDFFIILPDEQLENTNLLETKKRIIEAVGLIRHKVKNGRLLLQHNIEYGFFRNFIGGSIIGLLISAFNIFYFYIINDKLIFGINIGLSSLFALLFIFHRPIIINLGNQYAKRLFQEYLAK